MRYNKIIIIFVWSSIKQSTVTDRRIEIHIIFVCCYIIQTSTTSPIEKEETQNQENYSNNEKAFSES